MTYCFVLVLVLAGQKWVYAFGIGESKVIAFLAPQTRGRQISFAQCHGLQKVCSSWKITAEEAMAAENWTKDRHCFTCNKLNGSKGTEKKMVMK